MRWVYVVKFDGFESITVPGYSRGNAVMHARNCWRKGGWQLFRVIYVKRYHMMGEKIV